MLTWSVSNGSAQQPARRWSLVITALLLTLLAHLLLLYWLNEQLQSISLFAPEDDENSISVSLLRPTPPRSPPTTPPTAHRARASAAPTPSPNASSEKLAEAVPAPEPMRPAEAPAATLRDEVPIPASPAKPATATSPNTESAPSAPLDATNAKTEAVPSPAPAATKVNALFDKASPPPPAELIFSAIGVRKDGRSLSGTGTMNWRHDGQRYTLDTEISVLVFTLAKNRSEGELGALGIAPNLYVEKRFGRSETNTHFQQQARVISFSASTATIPTTGGEQDRGSWIWQLAALGRGNPGKFETGLAMEMTVASARGVDAWRIRVSGKEQLKLPDGEVSAWRLSITPGPESFDKQFDLWLAPDRQWYPVRLIHEDKNGNRVELFLSKITER